MNKLIYYFARIYFFFGVLLFILVYTKSVAQVNIYTFSQASSSYSTITGDTVVATATGE